MVKLMADSADKLVGQRIQARRKEAGLTAADLAETIDISQQQLSRYERGTNKGFVNGMVASHLLCHSGTINRHSLNGAL
ncbi:helix-turn-helix domain-containing protein, partial [Raoultella ornithinolytica]|uniref:helix-turn-helix domain-containing protein n=3 Tax=Raoultella ornithinolytica TaxID=54291 RepID=UPI001F223EB5